MSKLSSEYLHLFTPYYSSIFTQKYLKKAYNQSEIIKAETYSYENCNKFISYLENGSLYFKQMKVVPTQLKPLLLYYGFTHFLKACLLVVDPLYPETTAVLSHGVSTRKKKKQQYEFLFDEIKIQRHGLFTHTAEKIFHLNQLENEKITMIHLLQEIPELETLFIKLKNKRTCAKVVFNPEHSAVKIPEFILDEYKMNSERFKEYIKAKWDLPIVNIQEDKQYLNMQFEPTYCPLPGNLPFRFNIHSGTYSLSLQREGVARTLPDLLILYLLLYNLSMISRYETEWWSDLFKEMPFYDLPFIDSLLNVAEIKIPFLVSEWLNQV